jgi:hypothetical protein
VSWNPLRAGIPLRAFIVALLLGAAAGALAASFMAVVEAEGLELRLRY